MDLAGPLVLGQPSSHANRPRLAISIPCPASPAMSYFTINTALGTHPASFSVCPKSTPCENVLVGNVVVKLLTSICFSASSACATSNSVVSAGYVFITFPPAVCNRSRASVCAAAGREAAGLGAGAAAGAAAAGARPSRAALASSALRRRSSLSASILALMRRLASRSAAFSAFFFSTSLSCSLRPSSSFRSWVSLVDLWRICCGGGLVIV